MFEHTVTYLPVRYHEGKKSGVIFKDRSPQTYPDPASLWNNSDDFEQFFQQMGQDGWELVSVQPLLEGEYKWSSRVNESYGLGFSITAGYYLFWKRPA